MADSDKLNIDSIIQRLLEGNKCYSFHYKRCRFIVLNKLVIMRLKTYDLICVHFVFIASAVERICSYVVLSINIRNTINPIQMFIRIFYYIVNPNKTSAHAQCISRLVRKQRTPLGRCHRCCAKL